MPRREGEVFLFGTAIGRSLFHSQRRAAQIQPGCSGRDAVAIAI
jgi:hypothetical protein